MTKIIGEPRQGDINLLEQELAEKAAKIKTTAEVVEKGKKFGFLVVGLGRQKHGSFFRNPAVKWDTPENPGGL